MRADVVIVGAGAAGLFCAFEAARRGRSVLLLERAPVPGKKILISGGGRCNFTNLHTSSANFLSENPHFAKSALARYTPSDFIELLGKHKIPWHEKKLGQLFCDRSARDVVAMLEAECRAAGVRTILNCRVESVERSDSFRLSTSAGEVRGQSLVIATGGLSIPKIGATPFGYRVAEQFGLSIVKTRPALVPLTFQKEDARRFCDLAGVATEVVALAGEGRFQEKMLITHKGLSGPAILQISSYWKPGYPVLIDLLPSVNFADFVNERRRQGDRSSMKTMLASKLPSRLADRWLQIVGETSSPAKVDESLHRWQVYPGGTEGYEKAEVTAGGVDTSELSSQTMESRKAPGLFFIGEVVDVTGHLGGFNFQWAWASASAAAQSV